MLWCLSIPSISHLNTKENCGFAAMELKFWNNYIATSN